LLKYRKGGEKSSSSLFQIEGIGEVKIVLVDEGAGRVSYIVSSVDEEEMVKLKRLRWQTGKLNEELKNMLGMDEYRVRKKEGVMRHCRLLISPFQISLSFNPKFEMALLKIFSSIPSETTIFLTSSSDIFKFLDTPFLIK
jgi:hypothetical protein